MRVRVAPLVGAWIEIFYDVDQADVAKVAPLVGAWIEIRAESERDIAVAVAPLVGAWTEISAYEPIHNHNMLRYCRISS